MKLENSQRAGYMASMSRNMGKLGICVLQAEGKSGHGNTEPNSSAKTPQLSDHQYTDKESLF